MLNDFGPSVYTFNGHDSWRTWFIEECESSNLFGTTKGHLPYIQQANYRAGTIIYLEDAPYFYFQKKDHRVYGPYLVQASRLPPGGESIHVNNNQIIIYKEPNPKRGPWRNYKRTIEIAGVREPFKQMASQYEYFPLRFGIMRAKGFDVQLIRHKGKGECTLCSNLKESSVFRKKKADSFDPQRKLIKKNILKAKFGVGPR